MQYNFLLHIHPKNIKSAALKFNVTYGLGGIAVLLFVIQLITGLLLKGKYIPDPANAYDSILYLEHQVMFGRFIRNIHHWSAVLLIVISLLHLLRVVFTGAIYAQRKVNWYVGLGLLILVVLFNFTGYLLPWDQLSYWAVTISTQLLDYIPVVGNGLKHLLLGGEYVNERTLAVFYNLHTGIFPLMILILMAWHFWKVRTSGGVILKNDDRKTTSVPVNPELINREGVVALVLIAVVFILAAFFNAPLHDRANPMFTPNPTKAPWYFMGFQELLIHFHPTLAITFIPLVVIAALVSLPIFKIQTETAGVWFSSKNGRKAVLLTITLQVPVVFVWVLFDHYLISKWNNVSEVFSKGILPLFVLFVLGWGYVKIVLKKYRLKGIEKQQVLVAAMVTTYIVLTIIGQFFRGEDMLLTWPWNV